MKDLSLSDESGGSGAVSVGLPTKVLVTGGAGFIGANLIRALGERSQDVDMVVLDDLSSGDRENLSGTKVTFVDGSILDAPLLDELVSDVSVIVHLAARPSVPRSIEYPLLAHEVNATGTVLVLEAARRHGGIQVIVASSSSVYGPTDKLPKRESMATQPASPYAASKLAAESSSLAYAHSYDMPVLALRFFNVFGPLQPPVHAYAAAIPAFLAAASEGRPLPIYGDGSQTRDFTYVRSVVEVIVDAIWRRVTSPEPVNLAFGGRVSLLEVIGELEVILGRRLPVEFLEPRQGDVSHSQADPTRLRDLFPNVHPIELKVGLEETARWFEVVRPGG